MNRRRFLSCALLPLIPIVPIAAIASTTRAEALIAAMPAFVEEVNARQIAQREIDASTAKMLEELNSIPLPWIKDGARVQHYNLTDRHEIP